MKTILCKLKWFYAIALSLWFFVSCDPLSILGSGRLFAPYSLTPTEGLSTSHIPNEKFFYVNLHAAYYTGAGYDPLDAIIYAMEDGPGTDCKIPVEKDSTEDLYCTMDAMEGDLWYHNIELEYNVPESMCDYLKFDVSWHFNQTIGQGPQTVYQCSNYQVGVDADGNPQLETRYCLGRCRTATRGEGDNSQIVTIGCGDGTTTSYGSPKEQAQDFCDRLDKSQNELANCCMGDYNLISVTENTVSSTTEAKWGGNLQNCIGGLGRISWNEFNSDGFPLGIVTPTLKDGYKNFYNIPALIEIYGSNKQPSLGLPSFISANYWTDVENKDFTSSNVPKFYRAPTNTQLPTGLGLRSINVSGYPYLSWTCLDKAREIKHRIHLVIREWNTQEEYNSYKETRGSRGDPDVVGTEGSSCDYYEADEQLLRDTNCNDLMDADDWNKEEHGSGSNYNPYPEIVYK